MALITRTHKTIIKALEDERERSGEMLFTEYYRMGVPVQIHEPCVLYEEYTEDGKICGHGDKKSVFFQCDEVQLILDIKGHYTPNGVDVYPLTDYLSDCALKKLANNTINTECYICYDTLLSKWIFCERCGNRCCYDCAKKLTKQACGICRAPYHYMAPAFVREREYEYTNCEAMPVYITGFQKLLILKLERFLKSKSKKEIKKWLKEKGLKAKTVFKNFDEKGKSRDRQAAEKLAAIWINKKIKLLD